jgi:hypothetical protein
MYMRKLLSVLLLTNALYVHSYLTSNIFPIRMRKSSLQMTNEKNFKSQLYDRRNIMFFYLGTNLLGLNSIFLYDNMLSNIERKQGTIFYKRMICQKVWEQVSYGIRRGIL